MMNSEPHVSKKDPYRIDKDLFEPAYLQLANILRRQIAEGIFHPGDLLPSEAQLVRNYGISPMTVRRSINLLLDDGVVNTEQGKGTYVKPLELSRANFDLRELQDLIANGTEADVKLLDVRIAAADERVARKLGITIGQPAIFIARLFTTEGQPVFYHRAYLVYDPKRPIVEAEMNMTSLKDLFIHGEKSMLKRGRLTIEAALMKPEEAKILETPLPAAAFCLEHLFYDFEDRPVSWGWFIFRSDRLTFSTRIGIDV
jgi:DNA-binding GntR family transcriptional regulator